MLEDFYKVLGATPSDSIREVKRKFRVKAKALHPDANPKGLEAFLALRRAYEAVIQAHSGYIFKDDIDRIIRSRHSDKPFDYRAFLIEQGDDKSIAKLILYNLYIGKEDDACSDYKKANIERRNFDLSAWFDREEYMDWGYILAECLMARKEYYDASLILGSLITMEKQKPYFKLIFCDVVAMIKELLLHRIQGVLPDELAIDCWERALDLGLTSDMEHSILELMAKAYERLGDTNTRNAILKALRA